MAAKAKRAGGEKRGNSADRRARRAWMLRTWGDGETCPCVFCKTPLVDATVEADRITPGGSYRRENVQPACRACNLDRSNDEGWSIEAAIKVGRIEVSGSVTIRHKKGTR